MTRIAFLFLSLLIASCGKTPAPAPTSPPEAVLPANYQRLTPDEAQQLIASTPTLGILDVRDEDEMRNGRGWIPGAKPCSYLHGNRTVLQGLDRSKPWLVYCAIGGRADYTAEAMGELGFQQVYLIKGGFNAWLAAGKPVVK